MEAATVVRVIKRLKAAAGYYELGMTGHALERLDSLGELEPIGPFALAAEIMRAEFLKAQADYGGAAAALESAACTLPGPQSQALRLALSACYFQAGDVDRAVNNLGYARGAKPPEIKPHSA
jgi:tetratricopeptide (TPR) repeat protein